MQQHEVAFREMKTYYNDITNLNLEMIQIQKTKLQDIKVSIENNEKLVNTLKEECEKKQIPLDHEQAEVKKLSKNVSTYDKDVMALRNAKGFKKDLF